MGKALEAKIDRPAGVVRWVTGPGPCWLPASACQTNPLPDNKHAHACMHACTRTCTRPLPDPHLLKTKTWWCRFSHRQGPVEALNAWSRSIGRLLETVEKTCQQIQKESMIHKVPIGAA